MQFLRKWILCQVLLLSVCREAVEVYIAEQFHRLISAAFRVIGGEGCEDYAYPPYRTQHQITCQIMDLICILSNRNLDQIGNESE